MRKPFYLKRAGRFWHVRWNRESGIVTRDQTYYRTTGQTTKRAAERWCLREIERRRIVTRQVTLAQYLAPYYVWDECPHIKRLRTIGASIGRSHAAATRSRIERFVLSHAIAAMRFADINRGDLIDFQADLVRRGVGARTVNQVFEALKVVFTEAVAREDLDRDPAAKLENIRYERIERGTFTLPELHRLFPADPPGPWADLQDHTAYLLAWTTGMRKGELLALRWRSVDLRRALIRVDEAWKGLDGAGRPKWGRRRLEPLCAQAVTRLRDLRDQIDDDDSDDGRLIFAGPDGMMRSDWWWTQSYIRALRRIGIDDQERRARRLVPHGFRHTLVSFLRDKVDDAVLRDVVGHSTAAVTDDYTHFSIDQKRVVADTMDQLLA